MDIKERWHTEEGNYFKNFFLENINLEFEGYLNIQNEWKKHPDFFSLKTTTNKYRVDFGECIDLRGINLQNLHFENASFYSYDLTEANLTDCSFNKVDFQSILLNQTQIKDIVIENSSTSWFIIADSDVRNLTLKNENMNTQCWMQFCVFNTSLKFSKIFEMEVVGSYWGDVSFFETEIKNSKLNFWSHYAAEKYFSGYSSTTKKLVFDTTKIINTNIKLPSSWEVLLFENCIIDDVIFEQDFNGHQALPLFSPLAKNLSFLNTNFKNVHFKNANLSNCTFENCSFEDVVFENCVLNLPLFSSLLRTGKCKFININPPNPIL